MNHPTSYDRRDLDDLLAVIEDFADSALAGSDDVNLDQAQSTPLPTLVHDLIESEVPDALAWAFEVVEVVAARSASWGFVLASRYAATLAARETGAPTGGYLALGDLSATGCDIAAAPTAAGPIDSLVVLDRAGGLMFPIRVVPAAEQPERTGLAGAKLARLTASGVPPESAPTLGAGPHTIWSVLLGAAISGLGTAMLRDSVRYTNQRQQFGAPIASFTGLRAVVGRAYAESRRTRELLHAHAKGALSGSVADALSSAADATLNCAVEAVQTHGGYGYIDEFGITKMFADAVSLRARAADAVEAWRRSADLAYANYGQAAQA